MRTVLNSKSETLSESELVLNPDGSVYHLHLKPEHIADTVLLVGDQGRVEQVTRHFSDTEFVIQNREFCTATGTYNGKRVTVLSTGIGTDNIDIAINELDAAVNIDLETRTLKANPKSLNFVRIGTCGSLQEDVPVDALALSTYGLGFDGLLDFYNNENTAEEAKVKNDFESFYAQNGHDISVYVAEGDTSLVKTLENGMYKGITATANGFFGPQGRVLRLQAKFRNKTNCLISLDQEIIE